MLLLTLCCTEPQGVSEVCSTMDVCVCVYSNQWFMVSQPAGQYHLGLGTFPSPCPGLSFQKV